jgi:hypothetical protein
MAEGLSMRAGVESSEDLILVGQYNKGYGLGAIGYWLLAIGNAPFDAGSSP